MPSLPISQLPSLTAATNETLIAVVFSGVSGNTTYQMTIQDLIKSTPFGTMYQSWIPDVTDIYEIGSPTRTIKEIHVGTGTVFIGPNGALGIDDTGVLFSLNGFASNFLVLGAVTESGVTITSGVTFTVVNDEVIFAPVSGQTYNLNQQLIPTGGTVNQVLTQTGNTLYDWGWVSYSANTSGTSGSSGSSGTSGIDGTSGSSGSSGTSGIDGTSGSSGSSGTSGTSAPTPPYPFVYGLFAQTGNSVTVSGTTSESTLIDGGVGTLTVPASGFTVGDSFRVDMAGVLNVGNNQTIRIRVKTGSVVLLDSTAQAITNITNDIWGLSINFTIRQIGGPGVASIVSLGAFHYTKTSNGAVEGFSFNTVNNTTFDTTISNTLDITVEWGSTSVSNSIYSDIFVLNKIY